MKLRQIASNMTEIETNEGALVLFSYETPVAARTASGHFFHTEKKFSVTTSKHITKWLAEFGRSRTGTEQQPQDFFNTLVS